MCVENVVIFLYSCYISHKYLLKIYYFIVSKFFGLSQRQILAFLIICMLSVFVFEILNYFLIHTKAFKKILILLVFTKLS